MVLKIRFIFFSCEQKTRYRGHQLSSWQYHQRWNSFFLLCVWLWYHCQEIANKLLWVTLALCQEERKDRCFSLGDVLPFYWRTRFNSVWLPSVSYKAGLCLHHLALARTEGGNIVFIDSVIVGKVGSFSDELLTELIYNETITICAQFA